MSAINGNRFVTGVVKLSSVGVANGVAGLDGSGKIATSALPSGVTGGLSYKGALDASAGSYPSSPANGDFYQISVAGTISGHDYSVGDSIFYSDSETRWDVINNASTTDEVTEGSRLYFTDSRAQAAAVVNALSGSQTNQAPSVSSVSTALTGKQASLTSFQQKFTLAAGDITNGYVILNALVWGNPSVRVKGLGILNRAPSDSSTDTDADYWLSTDGTSGNSKVNIINDLASGGATPLAAGDVIFVEAYHL